MVTFAPRNPSARSPTTASTNRPGSTGRGTYTHDIPSAANAALWITGDRLCSTGQPITPTVADSPSMRDGARSTKTVGLVEQELRVVRAELVVAVGTAE